jgi:hypothetical protein
MDDFSPVPPGAPHFTPNRGAPKPHLQRYETPAKATPAPPPYPYT